MDYDSLAREEEKIQFYKKEMNNHRDHVLHNISKVCHPTIMEAFSKVLIYSWQEDLADAHLIVELLELDKMDIASLQYDLDCFMEEYERYFEAQGF